jgi:Family of unknown function (DUF6516)
MLPRLEAFLRASPKVIWVQVIDHDAIDEGNFLLKIRCELTSGQILQIRLRTVTGSLRYSYQEFTDKPLRRWDNASHFPHLPNFPHHYHDAQGNITPSRLTGAPTVDLQQGLCDL